MGAPDAVAFRADAEPAHEIFYDRFFKIVLCTDEFALRVLRAGCTGMRFSILPSFSMEGATVRFAASRRRMNGTRSERSPTSS